MNKNKHFIIAGSITVAISIASLFAMLPLSATSSTKNGQEWMKEVNDDTSLTSLSIPGSHDSGALHSIADLAGKCQDLSISDQLNAGARFFDIRLQLRNEIFKVVHGFVDQNLNFSEVINDFKSFLTFHPSEALFVSIKEESASVNTETSFDDALKAILLSYTSIWDVSGELPSKIADLRGKIFLISRYKDNTIGLPAYEGWLDPDSSSTSNTFDIDASNLHVQDYYQVNEIENKQTEITKCFDYSNENLDKLTLNFSSCYFTNSFPPSYAGTTAKIINSWIIEEVKNRNNLGIIVSDFVTNSLCEAIYKRNFK